ncbi:hypothetical protein Achl_4214 (plasmid) [Pseudarthrobacter chlorophenolicus A6]|uniref:Uncharacterized protein n=1 Tax=Pseudarthrobacter chlorophenolicus (strain ATCC 700700 / DSM 12829 / CIP 107037 / JCM 12360 / KCTC 9906 / NCIMB 13794 / A6) TaxID=452863 RepID=B8HIB8_PSECP|nr:DUF2958 domain-containing protein [Pseudarthrobacter chlorophenolicus]ACL42165.1 hypothetical protein Achl_4214 [Pseudarthrobacter chlorophenolicus A6]SDQ14297.1 Protein of unknown function [Pseudarthrobacter chlorophenolicus]
MSTEISARQPKGIPVGGQFAPTSHSDAVPGLQQPAIENLAFDYEDGPFDVERDGEGRYTIYAVDDEGTEIASFSYDGDPADRASLEVAAVSALTGQDEHLCAVSSPGARVIWTDPDGGERHPGTVVGAKGEIIVVSLASGGEAEVFGNELSVDEEATKIHQDTLSPIDTAVIWTNPDTGEKIHGRSLGPIGGGNFAFQVPRVGGFNVAKGHELELAPPAPPAPPVKLVETQRKIRGHNFYAPKAVLSKVPGLGATENIPFEEKKFHLHYFAGGAANWYIAEVDPASGRAFGLMDPTGRGEGSWGYVSLPELEAVNAGGFRVVERDCYFSQGNLAHINRNQ